MDNISKIGSDLKISSDFQDGFLRSVKSDAIQFIIKNLATIRVGHLADVLNELERQVRNNIIYYVSEEVRRRYSDSGKERGEFPEITCPKQLLINAVYFALNNRWAEITQQTLMLLGKENGNMSCDDFISIVSVFKTIAEGKVSKM